MNNNNTNIDGNENNTHFSNIQQNIQITQNIVLKPRRKSKTKKVEAGLKDSLLRHNFIKSHRLILNLPKLSPQQIASYIFQMGFADEANLFANELLDGKCFITLLTTKDGLIILEHELMLSQEKIFRLLFLYSCIYRFRKCFCWDVRNYETPL
eukprot:TRINITY_DN5616_c0_g1_i1.p1 TRINITY_DN5616_c0_g1~~TRINITY_DN5616_c0_g1_i1.p1  ORF type:complete len:153 (-),score=22.02 TRINITY_DN5616_c0_g1_i1:98-556(-)